MQFSQLLGAPSPLNVDIIPQLKTGDFMACVAETKVAAQTIQSSKIDHDLIHELSRRIDALTRYDQYIANAREREPVRNLWTKFKSQEEQNVQLLKELLAEEMRYVSI